ncbi:MAG: helix-turn-helix transcriptional regulator [Saprospiraceae bacterium]|nr:helix-turn-helix transcriptional regulator [Saprospiraceae bacterium]
MTPSTPVKVVCLTDHATSVNAYNTRNSYPCFLHWLQICIERHLHDSDFDVSQLLRLVCMSRSDLHRKLKKTTGMSATAYIRYLRLQKAAAFLLERPNWSVFDVAFEVGFNDHSYFTKRFREVYGVCPGDFRERGRMGHTL